MSACLIMLLIFTCKKLSREVKEELGWCIEKNTSGVLCRELTYKLNSCSSSPLEVMDCRRNDRAQSIAEQGYPNVTYIATVEAGQKVTDLGRAASFNRALKRLYPNSKEPPSSACTVHSPYHPALLVKHASCRKSLLECSSATLTINCKFIRSLQAGRHSFLVENELHIGDSCVCTLACHTIGSQKVGVAEGLHAFA